MNVILPFRLLQKQNYKKNFFTLNIPSDKTTKLVLNGLNDMKVI